MIPVTIAKKEPLKQRLFFLSQRLRGLTLEEYFATLDPVSGAAYYAAVLLLVLMPMLVNRGAATSARS